MSMRRARLLLAVLAFAIADGVARAEPQHELRVAVSQLPASLGNPFKGNGRPGTSVWYAIFDALTELDKQGRLAPALATGWTRTDPLHWRFELRQDAHFSNGKKFDASAAARVLNWLASNEGRRTVIGNELRGMRAAHALEPFVLEVETSRPDPILPKRLAGALMVEPDSWGELGPDQFAQQPIGTGPYRLVRWDQRRRQAVTEQNPHGWRKPHVPRLVFLELPDSAVRAQALLSREVDVAPVELDELERLRRGQYPVLHESSMQVMSIALRVDGSPEGSPLRDIRVRQALNYAVDKETIARVLLHGLAPATGQPAPAITFGHDSSLAAYPYDPARARALLAEAGYPNGFSLSVDVIINSLPADSAVYQTVADDLRKVGVQTTLHVVTFPEWLKKFLANSWTVDGFGVSWNSAPYNDALRPMEVFSCRRPRPFFCDKALADELDRASGTLDDGERLAAMQALARRYHEAAPAIFLVEQIDLFAYRPGLGDVRLRNRVPIYERIREE